MKKEKQTNRLDVFLKLFFKKLRHKQDERREFLKNNNNFCGAFRIHKISRRSQKELNK